MPVLPYGRIAAPVVGIPHRQGSMEPLDVAGAVIGAGVGTVAADTAAPIVLECFVWLDVPGKDPRLKHGAGLAVGRALAQACNDADNRGTIVRGDALPQDAAVRIGHGET